MPTGSRCSIFSPCRRHQPSTKNGWPRRTDVKQLTAAQAAAERVVKDSSKDWYPNASVSFDPQFVTPPALSRLLALEVYGLGIAADFRRRSTPRPGSASRGGSPIVGVVAHRSRDSGPIGSAAGGRTVRAPIERWPAFGCPRNRRPTCGASATPPSKPEPTTNLEVIDAQRSLRDAESAVAIAQDALRNAPSWIC